MGYNNFLHEMEFAMKREKVAPTSLPPSCLVPPSPPSCLSLASGFHIVSNRPSKQEIFFGFCFIDKGNNYFLSDSWILLFAWHLKFWIKKVAVIFFLSASFNFLFSDFRANRFVLKSICRKLFDICQMGNWSVKLISGFRVAQTGSFYHLFVAFEKALLTQ